MKESYNIQDSHSTYEIMNPLYELIPYLKREYKGILTV